MKPSQFLVCLLSMVTVMLSGLSDARGQGLNPCDQKTLPPSFYEVPLGPQGDWKAFISPDLQQGKDKPVPVLVGGVGGIQGPVGRRGLRLGCGLIRNLSQKTVTAIQLRWILIKFEDRSLVAQSGYRPETVLREGQTPEVQLGISSDDSRRMDFSIISWAEITAPLTKDGILSGEYFLLVGINQVRFADGSVWTAAPLW